MLEGGQAPGGRPRRDQRGQGGVSRGDLRGHQGVRGGEGGLKVRRGGVHRGQVRQLRKRVKGKSRQTAVFML